MTQSQIAVVLSRTPEPHDLQLFTAQYANCRISKQGGNGLNRNTLFHLDYISCLLTVLSTVLVGRKSWTGWIVAAINSVLICVIGLRTSQFGFIPANLFCIALYAWNLHRWKDA